MTTLLVAYELALDETLNRSTLGFRERRMVRRLLIQHWESVVRDAMEKFRSAHGGPALGEDDDATPVIDFWKWILENEKVAEFIRIIIEEVLPAILKFIELLIPIIAAI